MPANSSGGRPSNSHGGVEGAVDDPVDDVPAAVAGGAGGADRRVVRPHRAVVVAERVVGAPSCRRGSAAPIPSTCRLRQPVEVGVGELGRRRCRSTGRGPGWSSASRLGRPSPSRADRRTSRARPRRLVEPLPQRRGAVGELVGARRERASARRARRRRGARRRRSPAPRRARSGPSGSDAVGEVTPSHESFQPWLDSPDGSRRW